MGNPSQERMPKDEVAARIGANIVAKTIGRRRRNSILRHITRNTKQIRKKNPTVINFVACTEIRISQMIF